MREEIVAQQDGRLVAPFGIDRGGMPADHGLVEDVVVHQRGRVDHLDDRRQHGVILGQRAARLPREQHERRPQPLALKIGTVVDQMLHERESAAELVLKDPLGRGQLRRDRLVERRQAAPGFAELRAAVVTTSEISPTVSRMSRLPPCDSVRSRTLEPATDGASRSPKRPRDGPPSSPRAESVRSPSRDRPTCTCRRPSAQPH